MRKVAKRTTHKCTTAIACVKISAAHHVVRTLARCWGNSGPADATSYLGASMPSKMADLQGASGKKKF